eukprot:1521878-Prymnesium_polylepis.1
MFVVPKADGAEVPPLYGGHWSRPTQGRLNVPRLVGTRYGVRPGDVISRNHPSFLILPSSPIDEHLCETCCTPSANDHPPKADTD